MTLVGKRLLNIRTSKNIERSEAAEYFGITPEELEEIELYNGDYDISLLVKSCKLYGISISFILDENEKALSFKTPKQEDYLKYEDTIKCVDNLINSKKKDLNYIKKPDCCKGPSEDYFAWRVLSTDYCIKGYVTMQDVKKMDSLYDGDIIVAIVKRKPVYGFFTILEDGIFIRPVNSGKSLSLTAKGSKIIGLVKHLDINVC